MSLIYALNLTPIGLIHLLRSKLLMCLPLLTIVVGLYILFGERRIGADYNLGGEVSRRPAVANERRIYIRASMMCDAAR